MLQEKFSADERCDGIALEWILPRLVFHRSLSKLRILKLARGIWVLRVRETKGDREYAGRENSIALLKQAHWRFSHRRLTRSPNPLNSREIPQRNSKRWLLSLSPKPGDRRIVQPDGMFQAIAGAR